MKQQLSSKQLIQELRKIITNSRHIVYKNINTIHVITNFNIGRCIVEYEQQGKSRAEYGKELLIKLSSKLTQEFGRGYSTDNLELMRTFYLTYYDRFLPSTQKKSETVSRKSVQNDNTTHMLDLSENISETVSRISKNEPTLLKLSWSHFVLLMKMTQEERLFYEIEAVKNNWSVRELSRQYDSSLFERLMQSKNKKKILELSRKGQIIQQPSDLMKQPYILEFLGLKEESEYTESQLESAIITRIEQFLLELGKGFLFDSRQKRITIDGDHFYIDLVFYNRLLSCFVLVDLKIGKLSHQNIGQMQMYVNYYDRVIKLNEENPTVGIILCKQANQSIIKFTLPEDNKQIFAREYKLYLPSKEELKKQLEMCSDPIKNSQI